MADNGSTVAVHYKGMLDDGSVFDSSEGRDPLEFVLGEGNVIPGFEQAVAGMEVGDSKTVKIPCAEAYGERNEDMMMAVPRDQVPPEITPEVGMMLQIQTPQGPMPVRVGKVTEENIMLDANHPLAGQDLTFELELVEVR
jgi:peptidylprolyl isomerase